MSYNNEISQLISILYSVHAITLHYISATNQSISFLETWLNQYICGCVDLLIFIREYEMRSDRIPIHILIYWFNDLMIYWFIDLLIYWSIDVLMYWCIDVLIYWFIDLLIYCLMQRQLLIIREELSPPVFGRFRVIISLNKNN